LAISTGSHANHIFLHFIASFTSFCFCVLAAYKIANGWRKKYLENLLKQDMSFFDSSEPGSLTLMLSDSAMEIQTGLSEKFVLGIQGLFQFFFGFAVAFYFGPLLSLVLMACIPVLVLVTTLMFTWGSDDGIFGKAAYESASTIATEAMSNIRTVASLNAESMVGLFVFRCIVGISMRRTTINGSTRSTGNTVRRLIHKPPGELQSRR
jgi:ATP-binding cassette, subfamily B (MDR/TAP), member 1